MESQSERRRQEEREFEANLVSMKPCLRNKQEQEKENPKELEVDTGGKGTEGRWPKIACHR